MKVSLKCNACRKKFQVELGQWNYRRAKYCSRPCSHEGRRFHRTDAEKKEIKRLYDIEFRRKNRERLKAEKAEYFKKVYAANPEKFQIERKKRKKAHKEYLKTYCARPEWKTHKKSYDQEFRAKKLFGPLWESAILTIELNNEVKRRMSNYEIRLKNGTLNKAMQRSRNGEVKRGYT